MKRPKLLRDPMARAFAIGEKSTAEPAESFDELARLRFGWHLDRARRLGAEAVSVGLTGGRIRRNTQRRFLGARFLAQADSGEIG